MDYHKSPNLTTLEAKVLDQYQLLASQLSTLSHEITKLTKQQQDGDSAQDLANNMRLVENKIGLINILFKRAVYTLFVEQERERERR